MTISSPSKASATESAPVGQNRFREAIVLTSLHINNYDATQFGPQCMQQDDSTRQMAVSLAICSLCYFGYVLTFCTCAMFKHLTNSIQVHGAAFVTGSGVSPLIDGREFIVHEQRGRAVGEHQLPTAF